MAGLVDGEGCIDMQGSVDKRDGAYYCRPRFRMTLSGKPGEMLMPVFVANFGGCTEGEKRVWENPNWLRPYTWRLTGKEHLRPFLQNIVNHLVIKKEQARLAIWWMDNLWGKKLTNEVKYFGTDEFKALKRDPHRLSEKAVKEITKLFD